VSVLFPQVHRTYTLLTCTVKKTYFLSLVHFTTVSDEFKKKNVICVPHRSEELQNGNVTEVTTFRNVWKDVRHVLSYRSLNFTFESSHRYSYIGLLLSPRPPSLVFRLVCTSLTQTFTSFSITFLFSYHVFS
jgi:hypothetical protein